jgi:hypothetical protein
LLWDAETENFIRRYLTELREENAAAFLGAGMSRAAGYVDWAGLMAPLANDLGLDVQRETDLIGIAQYHVNKNADNRYQINQLLIDKFSDLPNPTANHAILAKLPIRTFWTTNYDRLLERALSDQGKVVDSKYTSEHLSTTRRGRDATLYKMHGDIEHPNSAILTRDDYERYYVSHGQFIAALSGDLVSKTFLFLGFSFTDPNLNYVLSRIRVSFGRNQRQHFCVLRRRKKREDETDREFEYDSVRQTLQIADLMRFNIKAILVDDFTDVTELLRLIETRFRLRTIFISGSAVDYGRWGKEKCDQFLAKLASSLVHRNFQVSTGFGVGVGGAVVTGALEQIYADRSRKIDDQLIMRPFPITIAEAQRAETYQRYREDLVSHAGIAIFFMGNRLENGTLIPAQGMRTEFELATARGLYPIPIGGSGWMAKELWDETMGRLEKLYELDHAIVRPHLEQLGKDVDDPIELLEPLLRLLTLLVKD